MPAGSQIRAVLDTSVHVAALISSGPSAQIVEALAHGRFVSIVSEQTLDEVLRTILRPEKMAFMALSERDLALYHRHIKSHSEVVEGTYDVDLVPTDVKDNIIVAAALEGNATHIVSEDRDLLDLKALRIGGHNVVQVLRPRAFLNLISF